MLRQQLIVAMRKLKRPRFRPSERVLLVMLASVFGNRSPCPVGHSDAGLGTACRNSAARE
jgi:hypothetical protein